MKSTLSFFELKSLRKVTISILAIVFLVINTGCGGAKVSAQAEQPHAENLPAGQITNLYDPMTAPKGGINNYSDVDPRQNTSKADAKANKLIEKADHQEKFTNPVKEVKKELDKKGPKERVDEFSEGLSRSVQNKANDIADTSQKNFGNLKRNTQNFKEDVTSTAGDLGNNLKNKTNEFKNTAQETADAVTSTNEKAKYKG